MYYNILKKRYIEPFLNRICVFKVLKDILKPILIYIIDLRCSMAYII